MYEITGVDVRGKRFKKTTKNLAYAMAHNVYRGTLWERLPNGKRTRIHTWHN